MIFSANEDGSVRLNPETRMECKICWYVYDPAEGDAAEQIEPGTPFLELPAHWRCPQCDAEANAFLPMDH